MDQQFRVWNYMFFKSQLRKLFLHAEDEEQTLGKVK